MSTVAPSIPGYSVERLLGAGAHGRVFLARETDGLRRPVALKVFAPEFRDKFERELEMLRRVEEVRRRERALEIVQALGSGEAAGSAYIALEYLERGSLADVVAARGPLAAGEAVAHVRDAGRALAHLHREGLFHRDVKPANLLLGEDGRVRLSDFGLSRALSGTLSAAGSPAFAAPEVIAGRPQDGRLADVYSLGATLAFLLTGETMLPGRPDVFALERHGVPRALQDAIVAATAAEPSERLASVDGFMAQLESAKGEEKPDRGRSGSPDGDAMGARGAPGRTPTSEEAMRTDDVSLDDLKRPAEPKMHGGAIVSFAFTVAFIPLMFAIVGTSVALGLDKGVRQGIMLSLCLIPWALLITGIVMGFQSRGRIVRSSGRFKGKGLATAAIVVGLVELFLGCVLIPAVTISLGRFRAMQRAREERDTRVRAAHDDVSRKQAEEAQRAAARPTAEPTLTIAAPEHVRAGESFKLTFGVKSMSAAPFAIIGIDDDSDRRHFETKEARVRRRADGALQLEGRLESGPGGRRWVLDGDETIVTAYVSQAIGEVTCEVEGTYDAIASSDQHVVATLRYAWIPKNSPILAVVDAQVADEPEGPPDGEGRVVLARARARVVPFFLAPSTMDAQNLSVTWAGLDPASKAWITGSEWPYPPELGLYRYGWRKADFEKLEVREVKAEATVTVDR